MLLTLTNVLDAAALQRAQEMVKALTWRDGAETAGGTARQVKRNLQADLSTRIGTKLKLQLQSAIERHSVLKAAARPAKFSTLLISQTKDGGGYGLHIDNPYMGTGTDRLRTDLSFTLFLSDPDSYNGGELSIEHAGVTQSLKAKAGDLILYPSTSLHQVLPVTHGERYVCVGWIESHIRDPFARETLFDLENIRATLKATHDAQHPVMLTLAKSIANLQRLWG